MHVTDGLPEALAFQSGMLLSTMLGLREAVPYNSRQQDPRLYPYFPKRPQLGVILVELALENRQTPTPSDSRDTRLLHSRMSTNGL